MSLLLVALLSPPALADIPGIAWDAGNSSLPIHVTGSLSRDWGWSCDDPSDDFPLTQRCLTYDTTAGLIGSGNEIQLSDVDCGTANADPTMVTHTYDVTNPVSAHWYSYTATCQDEPGSIRRRNWHSVYDDQAPAAVITGAPPTSGTDRDVDFAFTCTDDVFAVDWDRYGNTYRPQCSLFCKLLDDQGGIAVTRRACDVSLVADGSTVATHAYTQLDPGTYTFELTPRDGVGQEGTVQTHTFTILGTLDTDAGDTDDTDAGDTDPGDTDAVEDTDLHTHPSDSDATDLAVGDTDDTDSPPDTDAVDDTDKGDCGCDAGGTQAAGWLLVLVGGMVRRRR